MKACDHQGERIGPTGSVNLSRSIISVLILVLLMANLWITWTGGSQEAAAASPQVPAAGSTGLRRFYQTSTWHDGGEALSACASGYHMASLWEISDVSNLRYDVDLGIKRADSGIGLPSYSFGWVRTGFNGDTTSTPGQANCDAWTSDELVDYGTVAGLPRNWVTGLGDLHTWDVMVVACEQERTVWCIED